MLDAIANWGNLIVLLGQIFVGWFMWSMRQSFVPKHHFTELEKTVAKQGTQLLLHEKALEGVPTDGDLHEIAEKMGEVHRQSSVTAATVEGIAEQLEGLSRQVRELNTYLLNRNLK